MTKVCHITSAHESNDVRIFCKECTSLARAGYDVYLVAQGESREENGVHVIGVGQKPTKRLARMSSFSRRIYIAAKEVDAQIYHFHDPELLPWGLKLARQGKTVIFDSHEHTAGTILEKYWLPAPTRRLVYSLFCWYQAYACRRLTAIVAATPHVQEYLSQYNANTILVTNYPVLKESQPVQENYNRAIVFAGGISDQWMHESILHALERIPDCRYVLCGWGDNEYLSRLQSLQGWKQTDYLGKIPHKEVIKQMASCAVGVALLRPGNNTDWLNGTMSNTKIFEEMQAGLPVVCTNFVLWREFVERWHCGICVNPKNVDEITAAIQYLLDHPEEARQMGENGRRAVKEEFNWGIEEKKLLELYDRLCKDINIS